jgi:hypothetical protein
MWWQIQISPAEVRRRIVILQYDDTTDLLDSVDVGLDTRVVRQGAARTGR